MNNFNNLFKVAALKQMNNYPKYYICIFIAFILEILSLTINYTEMD